MTWSHQNKRRQTTLSLVTLLRRAVLLPPPRLNTVIEEAPEANLDQIQECLKQFGPVVGIARLGSLHPSGMIDISQAGHAKGQYGASVLSVLTHLDSSLPNPRQRLRNHVITARLDNLVFEDLNRKLQKLDAKTAQDVVNSVAGVYDVPSRLPELDDLVDRLSDTFDLSDTLLIGHQHLLGSVASQCEALWSLGLEPANTIISGKPYSTNLLAALYLQDRGAQIRTGLEHFSPSEVADPNYSQNSSYAALTQFMLEKIDLALARRSPKRLVVLDDGGLLMRMVLTLIEGDEQTNAARCLRQLAEQRQIVGVEQTTFGIRQVGPRAAPTIGGKYPTIPVVSVAGSNAKLWRESPLIASSVVREIRNFLGAHDGLDSEADLGDKMVGVVGFGSVGSWVAKMLKEPDSNLRAPRGIVVFDNSSTQSSIARSFDYTVARSINELAAKCDIIIGCSGNPTGVHLDLDHARDGVILASASSNNHEFSRIVKSSIDLAANVNPDVTRYRSPRAFDWAHSIYNLRHDERTAYLLNAGFPVNFTGAVDPIAPADIQLTRCLMVAGVATGISVLSQPEVLMSQGEIELITLDSALLRESRWE